jgi:hypothetical protein
MTIDEIKKAQYEAENKMINIIKALERETQCHVARVDLNSQMLDNGYLKHICFKITLEV